MKFVFTLVICLMTSMNATAATALEDLNKKNRDMPSYCSAIEAEASPWFSKPPNLPTTRIPDQHIDRAMELLQVCHALPRAHTRESSALVISAIKEDPVKGVAGAYSLSGSECQRVCYRFAAALLNVSEKSMPTAKKRSVKQLLSRYLTKEKYPDFSHVINSLEVLDLGLKNGAWKLSESDRQQFESIKTTCKRASENFTTKTRLPTGSPDSSAFKESFTKLQPFFIEEIEKAQDCLAKVSTVATKLK